MCLSKKRKWDNTFIFKALSIKTLCSVLLLFLLTSSPRLLRGLDPGTPVDRYQLDEWSKNSPFPGHSVYNIAQTSDGFLWLDCSGGTVRFDGETFIPFHRLGLPNSPVTPRDELQILMTEQNGGLWLRRNCLGLLQYNESRIKMVNSLKPPPINIWLAKEDSYKNVWLGTCESLYCYNNQRFTEYGPEKGLPACGVSSIIEDRSGQLWVTSLNDGIFKFKEGRFHHYPIKGTDKTTVFKWLFEDRSGIVWIGTNKGLFLERHGQITQVTTADGLSHNAINDIVEDSDGNIWVGAQDGINRIRKCPEGTLIIDSHLSHHTINVIFEDKEKNLWIGTENQGLKRFRDAVFNTIDFGEHRSDSMTCLHRTACGDIWLGTLSGDLMRIEDKNHKQVAERFSVNSQIISMASDKENNLWIGTTELGLFCLTPGRDLVQYTDQVKVAFIPSLFCDSRNRLWIGTEYGFLVRRNGKFKSYRKQKGYPDSTILFFREDAAQNIWIGSFGLFMLEKGRLDARYIKTVLPPDISDCAVSSIFFDEDDTLWIGTYSGAIIKKQGKKFTRFQENIYWPNPMTEIIQYMFKDDAGYLWLNTAGGILRINLKELEDLAAGKIPWLLPRKYGASDGLTCSECAAGSDYSAINPRKNEYWFCTKKGIALLKTEKVKINKIAPHCMIEKIKADGKDIPTLLPQYTIKKSGHLRFHFTAASFSCQAGVRFKYRLQGHDKDWRLLPPSNGRSAEYWNLPPGTYTFTVNACNNDGVWNHQAANVKVLIPPGFLGSSPVKISLLGGLVAALGLLYYLHRNSLRRIINESQQVQATPNMGKNAKDLIRLKELLEEDKIYRDDSLSITALARQMKLPRHCLSLLINEELHKSFFDLINHYRVEEAKERLVSEEGRQRNILDIAFDVGFNTKSAFNRAFKKHTRMTPSQYRDRFSDQKKSKKLSGQPINELPTILGGRTITKPVPTKREMGGG